MMKNKLNSLFLIGLTAIAFATANQASAQTATKADIEAALKHRWDKAGKPGIEPRTAVEIKSIKIGATAAANAQE
jgi:hypothetical protein